MSQKHFWVINIIGVLFYILHINTIDDAEGYWRWGSGFSLFLFIALAAVAQINRIDHLDRTDGVQFRKNPSAGFFPVLLLFGILYYLSVYILLLWIFVTGLSQAKSEKKYLKSDRSIRILLLVLIAIYIPIQVWFNAALINTASSDESFMGNKYVAEYALIVASIGFGLLMARFIRSKGTNFFIPFVLGFCVIFFGQEHAINYWASKQDSSTQISSLFGVLAKSAIANHARMPGEEDEFKTPEQVRLELLFLPAKITMMSNEDLVKNIVMSSNYVSSMLTEYNSSATDQAYARFQREVGDVWESYIDYIKMVAMRHRADAVAPRGVPDRHITSAEGHAHNLFMRYATGRHFEINFETAGSERRERGILFSCRGIAADIIVEIQEELPRGMTLSRALQTERGRSQLLSALQQEGIVFPTNWRFTNRDDLFRDLHTKICELNEENVRRFEAETGRPLMVAAQRSRGLENERPYTISEFVEMFTGVPGITNYEDINRQAFMAYGRSRIEQASATDVLAAAEAIVTENGSEWFKAAMMPAIGVTASFIFLFINLLVLVSGVARELGLHFYIRVVSIMLVSAIIVNPLIETKSLSGAFYLAQESTYRNANYFFTSLGYTPTLSNQSDDYKATMRDHHLQRASVALNQNRLTTPASTSALFHVSMAKYYDNDAETNSVLQAMIDRYESLGADSPDSRFNDRYNYILKWRSIYL